MLFDLAALGTISVSCCGATMEDVTRFLDKARLRKARASQEASPAETTPPPIDRARTLILGEEDPDSSGSSRDNLESEPSTAASTPTAAAPGGGFAYYLTVTLMFKDPGNCYMRSDFD